MQLLPWATVPCNHGASQWKVVHGITAFAEWSADPHMPFLRFFVQRLLQASVAGGDVGEVVARLDRPKPAGAGCLR